MILWLPTVRLPVLKMAVGTPSVVTNLRSTQRLATVFEGHDARGQAQARRRRDDRGRKAHILARGGRVGGGDDCGGRIGFEDVNDHRRTGTGEKRVVAGVDRCDLVAARGGPRWC